MNIKETIRAEIKRLIDINKTKNGFPAGLHCAIRIEAYELLLDFLDTLPEQPAWKPSEEDLDAIKELIDDANKRGWVTPGASRLYEQLKAL